MAQSTFYFNTKSTSNWTSSANMVDGTNTTYATTSADATTETLTGNTNNLSSGSITAVELRIYGFGDGDDTVVLTPRFNGSTNGDNYTITPGTSAAYSAWQNITSSTNAPGTWTFTDIDNLDCLVNYTKSGKADTMRVGIVELRVTYTAAPTVTTSAATSVVATSATGNGNITDTGGANATVRGFVWDTTSNPTVASNEGIVNESGSYGTGTFSLSMTSLTPGTTYHYRAYATNPAGTSYGADTTFTTNTPPTVALNNPADTATGVSTTPTLEFTGTDAQSDDIRYNVQVDTVNTFDSDLVVDSYNESNSGSTRAVSSTVFHQQRIGQSFTGDGSTIDNVTLYLSRSTSSTGNATVKIYAHTGTFGSTGTPNGAALATSDNLDVSTLSTSISLVAFNFSSSNKITLANGTNYFAVLEYNASSSPLNVGYDITSPTHPGNAVFWQDSSSTWIAQPTSDVCFYVYSDGLPILNKVSGTDAGFANTVTPADTDPFNSGEKADYDVQVADTLDPGTTYYWRVRGIDPSGSNTYGDWATTRSFTTSGGGTETADTAAVTATLSVPSTTATYDEVVNADVAVISNTIIAQDATATYVQVETAGVAVISNTITPQDATATYDAVQTADTAAVTTNITAQDVTATYDAVISASVTEISSTLTAIDTTATYDQIETAGVAEVSATLTAQDATAASTIAAEVTEVTSTLTAIDATATYDAVISAGVAEVTTTLTAQDVTANYDAVITAGVAEITNTITAIDVTATYIQVETASVAVVATTLSVQDATATYTSGSVAGVDAITFTLSEPGVTATYNQTETASLAVVDTTLTVHDATATYIQVETASLAVISNTFNIPAVTATQTTGSTAGVAVVDTTLSLPATTATYDSIQTASLAEISNTLSVQDVTAAFDEVYSGGVAAIDTTLNIPAVTADGSSAEVAGVTEVTASLTTQDVTAAYDAIVSADVAVVTNTLSVPSVTATSTDTHTALSDVVTITLTPTTANPLHNGYTTLPSLMFDIDGNAYKRLQSDRLVKL